MTEPSRPRPVPGPPRPGGAPAPGAGAVRPAGPAAGRGGDPEASQAPVPLAGLDARPVTEHVAAFEAEYRRLERELATIDRL